MRRCGCPFPMLYSLMPVSPAVTPGGNRDSGCWIRSMQEDGQADLSGGWASARWPAGRQAWLVSAWTGRAARRRYWWRWRLWHQMPRPPSGVPDRSPHPKRRPPACAGLQSPACSLAQWRLARHCRCRCRCHSRFPIPHSQPHRHPQRLAGTQQQHIAAAVELGGGGEFSDQEGVGVVRMQFGHLADREAGREPPAQAGGDDLIPPARRR